MIRLAAPSIEDDDLQAVRDALASGQLVQADRVAAFEQAVARYTGTEHAVAVSSGTAALHLALLALGVGPGDLVLVTAYSYVATANVVELCGAQPVFVDIRPDTFNLDPRCLERQLARLTAAGETARRVKAILPVHAFGQMADMPEILRLANTHGVPVIEDAACALGARFQGKAAGGYGAAGCFSFHPRKAITTGEGGMVTTDDASLARRVRALRNHGQDPESPVPDFVMPGFNYRLTELQAALGVSQMGKVDRIIAARRRLAASYDELLANAPSVRAPVVSPGSQPVYQSYVACLTTLDARGRDALIERLKARGVQTTIGTWHMPLTTYYRARYGYRPGDFPVADQVSASALSLPLFEALSASDQRTVIQRLTEALSAHA